MSQGELDLPDVEPVVSRGHPHDGWAGWLVSVNGGVPVRCGTPGAVLVQLSRHVIDLDGKVTIEVERQEG